ncbi:hypothetical protein [Streptomyces parvus]|uniref:Uncharacterized protein n=1 Tax=Streptomyces parvus TaxID=66428 RepID=A0A7K3S291_9ACTN|nr:hypothetical protein [Streptomyces parvus]NEC21469.1 hypothetical protein [Streptomyces parvus]
MPLRKQVGRRLGGDGPPVFQPKSPEMKGAAMMAPPEMTAAAMVAIAAMAFSLLSDLFFGGRDEKNANSRLASAQRKISGYS